MYTNRQPGALSLAINPMRPMFGMPRFFHDAPGDGGGPGGGGGGDPQDPKPGAEFTPEQQAKLQELINDAFGKGASKAEKAQASKIQQLEAELAKLKTPKPQDKPQDKPEGKVYTQAELQDLLNQKDQEYKPKLTAAEERVAKLLDKERLASIISAAAKANAIDPDDVALLVGRFVTHDDDGKVIVLNEHGNAARLNSKGDPMSVEEFVKSFVDGKPHLKRGANTPGVGSSSANTQDPKIPLTAAQKIAAGLKKQ